MVRCAVAPSSSLHVSFAIHNPETQLQIQKIPWRGRLIYWWGTSQFLGIWAPTNGERLRPQTVVRTAAKKILCGIAIACVAPLGLCELALRGLTGRDVFFEFQGELLSLVPGKIGSYVRNAYYWMTLDRCPLSCRFLFGSVFTHSDVTVGNHVYVGSFSQVGRASLGDNVLIADHVHVLSGKHQHGFEDPSIPIQQQKRIFSTVQIGSNSWLGANCVVMANVGKNCVIGAGSVVTRPVVDNSVAAGNPARILRQTYPQSARTDSYAAELQGTEQIFPVENS